MARRRGRPVEGSATKEQVTLPPKVHREVIEYQRKQSKKLGTSVSKSASICMLVVAGLRAEGVRV